MPNPLAFALEPNPPPNDGVEENKFVVVDGDPILAPKVEVSVEAKDPNPPDFIGAPAPNVLLPLGEPKVVGAEVDPKAGALFASPDGLPKPLAEEPKGLAAVVDPNPFVVVTPKPVAVLEVTPKPAAPVVVFIFALFSPKIEGSRLYRLARLRNSCSSLPSYFFNNLSISDTFDGLYFW